MAVTDFTADCTNQLRADVAKRLLAAGLMVVQEHKADLSRRTNPAPHKTPAPRGEFPAVRTGFGRSQVATDTVSLTEIEQTLRIRVGIREPGKYLLTLAGIVGGLALGGSVWKGLLDTAARVRGRAIEIIRGA